jgi:hypothetical protein
MRTKLTKITLAAIIAVAMALTFTSCAKEDDDGGGDGGGISDLPTQLFYRDGSKSNDNSDIMLSIRDVETDKPYVSLAGKIQNGKITLNLPNSIDNKYLYKASCEEDPDYPNPPGYVCIDKLSGTKDLYYTAGKFYFNNPEKGQCWIYLTTESVGVAIIYFSKSGKMTGTFEQNHCWYDDWYDDGWDCTQSYTETYDIDFSAGWNVTYFVETDENKSSFSTNKSVLKGEEPKWVTGCGDD